MYEWFECAMGSHYFSAAQLRITLAFLHLKTVDQNAPSEAELLDLTSIPYVNALYAIVSDAQPGANGLQVNPHHCLAGEKCFLDK